MMKRIANGLGQRLAHYLNQPIRRYEPFDISDPARVAAVLRPARNTPHPSLQPVCAAGF